MSAVVGERDRALRSTIPRNVNPTAGKDLLLDADPGAVHFNYDGTATTPTITLTAKPIGFDATVLWSIAGGGVLSGTGKNVRTMAASSMTSASVRVVATVVFEGQAYIATKTIFKLTDGAPGLDADPADLSPASLLAALEGRITDSQLYADLRAKINLITDPVSMPGSVQAQIKAETDARVVAIGTEAQIRNDAIGKEVGDRIAAVLAESGARTTYVQSYTFSKAEVNSALSIQATQIAAANTYTDTRTGAAISTAAADVRNYSYSKADTTSAISAAETRLRAEFVSGNGATEAYVQNWSYSKAASDSAEATQTATLTTSYQGYADQKKSEAKVDAAADVRNYAYSKAAIDSSEATQSATLTTGYTAYADAARTAAVSTANADVRQYAYSKSTVDSAISSAIQQLRSEFVGSGGATEAYVTNYAYSKSQIDQAEALQSSTLSAGYTNAVNNIKVGGTNLYPDGDFERGTHALGDRYQVSNFEIGVPQYATVYQGRKCLILESIAGTDLDMYGVISGAAVVRPGVQHVFSFMYATGTNSSITSSSTYLYLSDNTFVNVPLPILHTSNVWTLCEFLWTCPPGVTSVQLRFGVRCSYYTWMAVDVVKIEEGNKRTAWSAAPVDIQSDIAGAQTAAITTAAADVRQYAYAKSDAAGAFASQSSTITAAYQTYADNAKAAAIAASAADIRNYSYSKAEANSAIAQSTSSLTTTVGQHTTTLQTQGTSISGLSAQYTVKIDNNGRISGFGLASTPVNGAVYSIFAINADAFSVGAPGVANKQMFTVGQVNGQVAMVVRGDVYADGDITARMLKIGTSDNIVPDPAFHDLGWWGRDGGKGSAAYWADAGQSTGWLAGASLYLAASAGELITYSKQFPITPGATYLVQCQVSLTSDFNGRFSAHFTVTGAADYPFVPAIVSNWSDGMPVQLNSGSAKGLIPYTTTVTIPLGATLSRGVIQIRNSHTVGYVEIGSVSITRVADATLIGPGVVETKHLIIDKGGAIYSGQTGFDLGEGFWLEGANADHGARLSLGNSGGAKILADPRRGIFGLYNFPIINPQLAQKTITGLFNIQGMNGIANGSKQSLGSQTASMSNASGAVHYVWSAETSNGTLTIVPNGANCAIYAQAQTNGRCQGTVNCTGTDGSGFSASASIQIDVGFGSGVPA